MTAESTMLTIARSGNAPLPLASPLASRRRCVEGIAVGACVGDEGACVGNMVEGIAVGACVGSEGACVGNAVGRCVGIAVGACVGIAVGIAVGACVGSEGAFVGPAVGKYVRRLRDVVGDVVGVLVRHWDSISATEYALPVAGMMSS